MQVKISQASRLIAKYLKAGLVPMLVGSPGCGKSAIIHQIAKEYNLFVIDLRLSQCDPTDLMGFPTITGEKADYVPMKTFPIMGDAIPEGYSGWLLFLDEFNGAALSVQKAAYKLVLDRQVGQYRLHPKVQVVCAGNLMSDRALVSELGTAMQSRMVHLELCVDFKEWLEDVAIAQNYDQRVIAYLSRHQDNLMNFDPNHNDKTFCCPRTWEFMNKLIAGKEVTEDRAAMYAGTITSGVAVDFIQFTKVFHNMVSIKDILANPKTCHVPQDNSTRWAVITHMMEKMTPDNWGALMDYSSRFSSDHRILFFRASLNRMPALRQHPAFIQHAPELGRYLFS